MLVKRSSKNQIVIPKVILEQAGLKDGDVYFDAQYKEGRILLVPLEVEEKISPEALGRFEAQVLKREPGDKVYGSMEEVVKGLHRGRKRHR